MSRAFCCNQHDFQTHFHIVRQGRHPFINKLCSFFNFYQYFFVPCTVAGHSGRLTQVRHSSRKSSATLSYQCVQYFSVSKQWYGCQCLGFLMCAQLLMYAIVQGGCMDTIRKRALEVDSGREIPCCTWGLDLCQYCTWLFSWMLYLLSYSRPQLSKCDRECRFSALLHKCSFIINITFRVTSMDKFPEQQ